MKKILTLILLLLFMFPANAQAAETDDLIRDEAAVLMDWQENALEMMAAKIYEDTGVITGLINLNECEEGKIYQAATAYMDEHFPELSADEEAKLMFIAEDYSRKRFVLYSSAAAKEMLRADDLRMYNSITDTFANPTDLYEASLDFFKAAYFELTGKELELSQAFTPVDRTNPLIVDEARVLSEDDYARLLQMAERISEEQKSEVAVLFVKDIGSMTAEAFSDDYYDYNGYGYGENDEGILFMVATESRDFAMTTHDRAIDVFADVRLEKMEEHFLPYLKKSDWAGAAEQFLTDSEAYLIEGIYAPEPVHIPREMAVIFFPIGFFWAKRPLEKYREELKSVKKLNSAEKYVSKLTWTHSENVLVRHTTEKETIEKPRYTSSYSGGSSSSASSHPYSSTHTSSSGRTHGGRSGKF